MKINIVIMLSLVLILSIPTAAADSWCLNSTQRYEETETEYYVNGSFQYTTFYNETEECHYGCAMGMCKQHTDNTPMFAFAILFVFGGFGVIYIGLHIPNEENRILGWLFVPVGLILLSVGMFIPIEYGSLSSGVNAILATSGYAVILLAIVLIFYFIVNILRTSFAHMNPYSREDKPQFG